MTIKKQINFGKDSIPSLFCKILIPTLLAMICQSVMIVIDGAFVGHLVGSDALAAINIFAPFWQIITGLGLMLGLGCSVVATIHLSHKKQLAANLNITQAIYVGSFCSLLITFWILLCPEITARTLGASDRLLPYVLDYEKYICLAAVALFLEAIGTLIIRLDGSPKYAMVTSSIPSILNVILDYVFIKELHFGISGAAIATSIGAGVGGIMTIVYLVFLTKNIHVLPIALTKKLCHMTIKNISHHCRLGFAILIGEIAGALMFFIGNLVFLKYMGEDGVAAFSVACYLLPFLFMIANAIAQSSQPIVSFNYGLHQNDRVFEAKKIATMSAIVMGIILTVITAFGATAVTEIFLNRDTPVFDMSVEGLPYFATCAIPFIINVSLIGFYQSIEYDKKAFLFSILRGAIFIIPSFILAPILFGEKGAWLAITFSEILTLIFIVTFGKVHLKNKIQAIP